MRSGGDRNCLSLALTTGNYDVIKLLLENGVDVDARDDVGETALFKAVDAGNEPVIELLLKHGADPNRLDADGEPVLRRAIEKGDVTVAKLLLDAGAKAYHSSKRPTPTLVAAACALCDQKMVEVLIQHGADVNKKGMNKETAIFSAVREGQVAIIKYLLTHKADVNHQNAKGESVLFIAIDEQDLSLVKVLLSHGAHANLQSVKDLTPLDCAIQRGELDIVKELLTQGADVNRVNSNVNRVNSSGNTPLVAAVKLFNNQRSAEGRECSVSVLKELLQQGADPNYVNKVTSDACVFHDAVRTGDIAMIEEFLKAGADVNLTGGPLKGTAL